jgi:D-alanine-D-alanine ligase
MRQEFCSNPKFELSKSLKIGVLYGGTSSERKISIRSGRAVNKALKKIGFTTCWIDPKDSSGIEKELKKIDLAFVALHGRGGEDGEIQTYLESRGVPYIGSDARSSKLAFDKVVAKKIFVRKGIPTPEGMIVNAKNWKTKLSKFPTPFFVKPPREGSSIGAFGVEDFQKEAVKIKQAIQDYGELMIEKKICGREFTVGVLGKTALPVVELKPKSDFYDYRAKYTKGMTDYEVPASISKKLSERLQKIAISVHQALGLRDFSRVDIMVDEKERPYVLEANSIPGFTELSLLPKAAKAEGISFEELCYRLVEAAYKRKK